MKTHYDVLGVDPDAALEDIKTAYRKAARKLHPDMNDGEHLPEYLAVAEAYEVVSDAERRSSYDKELAGGPAESGPKMSEPVRQYDFYEESKYTYQDDPTAPTPPAKVRPINPGGFARWSTWLAALPVLAVVAFGYLVIGDGDGSRMLWTTLGTVFLAYVTVALVVADHPIIALGFAWVTWWLGGKMLEASDWAIHLLVSIAVAGIGFFVAAKWRSHISGHMSPRQAKRSFSWGEAGAHSRREAAAKGESGKLASMAARFTADALKERLSDIPGARVFHTVHVPNANVIIDHVVLCGSLAVAINSFRVEEERWVWGSDGKFHSDRWWYLPSLSDGALDELSRMTGARVVGFASLMPRSSLSPLWMSNDGAGRIHMHGRKELADIVRYLCLGEEERAGALRLDALGILHTNLMKW